MTLDVQADGNRMSAERKRHIQRHIQRTYFILFFWSLKYCVIVSQNKGYVLFVAIKRMENLYLLNKSLLFGSFQSL